MSGDETEEKTRFVQVRVPLGMIDQIDQLVKNKTFSSRSEFFKRLASEYFGRTSAPSIKGQLKDPDVRQEIRDIVKEGL